MLEPPALHQHEGRSIFTTILLVLFVLILAYALLIACLSIPWVQRFALYAHKIRTPSWWHNIYHPEAFGFAKNQATPFNLKSSDGLTLFAWHVLPLGLYEQHEAALRDQQPGVVSDIAKTLGFKLMTSDPESRLVINFHGNAGHVAQGWRTDTYRVLTSSPSNLHIHLLTLDYRGFGVSTGSPTESGLISDGVELVNWAIHFARIPPERIVILGQSLGTAVATAVVHHFATNPSGPVSVLPAGAGGIGRPDGVTDDDSEQVGGRKDRVVFAGIVLVAAFSSLPVLLPTYRIAGFIPLLAPLSLFRLTRYVVDKILIDKWNSLERLQKYQRAVKGAYSYLALIHAFNDGDIPWTHSVDLFCGLVGAEDGREDDEMREEAERCYQKITEVRRSKRPDYFEWSEKDGRNVRLELVEYGGHNRIVTYSYISLAIARAFQKSKTKSSMSLI
ncbi:alpha/beta-hydrolase [Viridothelium virens]|uniref:Alpha/beta-hydrolase n=1 Tax=Viridothelium virens TaxID=1048519 RepID=A0A6A6GWY4_VIRVR|nr:alpha/beta-hydrolase [Viridothelium virens]